MQTTDNFFYHTILQTSTAEFKDRGSKFIAYTFPVSGKEGFKKQLDELKKNTPKLHIFVMLTGLV